MKQQQNKICIVCFGDIDTSKNGLYNKQKNKGKMEYLCNNCVNLGARFY